MEGLEVSEIKFSELENGQTVGAEYYAPMYLRPYERLISSRMEKLPLAACCKRITDGDHGSAEYAATGVLFILSEAVGEGWIEKDLCRFITPQHASTLQRSRFRTGDVLVTKTGVYFGKSAVVSSDFDGANTIAHVGILTPTARVDSYYLSTFLNTIYGQAQLRRRGIKATRPEIKLLEFPDILLSVPSSQFQHGIRQTVLSAHAINEKSHKAAMDAEEILLKELGLDAWRPPDPLSYTRRASEVFTAERLDAEHYKEKYLAAKRQLSKAGARDFVPLTELLDLITNGHTPLHHDLTEGEVPFLCAEHVADFELNYESEKRILLQHHGGELSRTALQEGDVLLTIKGRVGNVAIAENVPGNVNINQDVALLRFNHSLPLWYLVAFLNSYFGKLQTEQFCTGGINPFLGLSNVKRLSIPRFDEKLMKVVATRTREKVHQARIARREAYILLNRAKRAVEIAIEQSEAEALRYVTESSV